MPPDGRKRNNNGYFSVSGTWPFTCSNLDLFALLSHLNGISRHFAAGRLIGVGHVLDKRALARLDTIKTVTNETIVANCIRFGMF